MRHKVLPELFADGLFGHFRQRLHKLLLGGTRIHSPFMAGMLSVLMRRLMLAARSRAYFRNWQKTFRERRSSGQFGTSGRSEVGPRIFGPDAYVESMTVALAKAEARLVKGLHNENFLPYWFAQMERLAAGSR